jgi:redox-sensing transcriptional repressor
MYNVNKLAIKCSTLPFSNRKRILPGGERKRSEIIYTGRRVEDNMADYKKEMNEKEISPAVIKRLPRYYRYLGELLENEVVRISSKDLSERMKVTASQIRQDLNNFGGFGQQGYGYNVEYLYNEIGKILGLNHTNNVIIVGAGNLGQALANYQDFDKRGFKVIGLFDVNPRLVGISVRGVDIHDIDELQDFIQKNDVKIAALTLPKQQARQMAVELMGFGIRAFWNFAPIDLNMPEDIIVENVHLAESLMRLSYKIHSTSKQ